MNVPARVLASEPASGDRRGQNPPTAKNATHLPGMVEPALCMPDGHQGYGFPVGGVGAIDARTGCISPGAVGYDINCGVRMVKTNLTYDDVRGREPELVNALFEAIPSGLGGGRHRGRRRRDRGRPRTGRRVGRRRGVRNRKRPARCEDEGRRPDARPEYVSQKAMDRGRNQMGSLGSGNHFLEVCASRTCSARRSPTSTGSKKTESSC